jgi:hypothetical protein
MGPSPINVEDLAAEYSRGNTDSVPGDGDPRDTEVFRSPRGSDDATAAASSYADHVLTPAAMATPGGSFLTTAIDTVDEDDEVVYPPPSRDQGPPGSRRGLPEDRRTTETHGPPANPVHFGKPHGGGARCTAMDCHCGGWCRDAPGYPTAEKMWCFEDHLGYTHWCNKATYTRAKQRFIANEQGRPRVRAQSAAPAGTPGAAADAAADRAPTAAASSSHIPPKARPGRPKSKAARSKSKQPATRGRVPASDWYSTAHERGISHPICFSCGLLGVTFTNRNV